MPTKHSPPKASEMPKNLCVLTCLPARWGRFQYWRIPILAGRAPPA
jgi:hypothetical protein